MKASNMGKKLRYHTKLYLCRKFYEACYYLWTEKKLVLNDLKLENVLISDCFSKLVLCDFGHASEYGKVFKTFDIGT
jgi:serine/threonine protein kinase